MTTVVGDAKRKIIVSDSQLSDDESNTKSLNNSKVYKVPQGLLAGAGDFISIQQMVQYFMDGKKGKPPVIKSENDADFMLLSDEGLFVSDKDLRFLKVTDFEAIGSGTTAALAVMSLGHTAEEACWAATQVDLYSGGAVRIYSLGEKEPTIWNKENQ